MKELLIVGGGAAGWITACYLAKMLSADRPGGVRIRLVESEEIGIIGVGEGTFPSIRKTLRQIGLDENLLIRETNATFKQGIRFDGWIGAGTASQDSYFHPFQVAQQHSGMDLLPYWLLGLAGNVKWEDASSVQKRVVKARRGPKLPSHPQYAAPLNYAYHFDAVQLAALLRRHAIAAGVERIVDTVSRYLLPRMGQSPASNAGKAARLRPTSTSIAPASGAELIGKALGSSFKSYRDELFCNRAVAIQVPSEPSAPIASCTISTAQSAGWIWEIGLQDRRGLGYVYSSDHTTESCAEEALRAYIGPSADRLPARHLRFEAGFRPVQWIRNCVAIGLSAGFIEPLEATGIGFAEIAALILANLFPWGGQCELAAKQFNEQMAKRYEHVIDFIKLHYCLNRRADSDFWSDNRSAASMSDGLTERLERWRHRPPSFLDIDMNHDIFTEHNWQYVLYGMGFRSDISDRSGALRYSADAAAEFADIQQQGNYALTVMPSHRSLVEQVRQEGFPGLAIPHQRRFPLPVRIEKPAAGAPIQRVAIAGGGTAGWMCAAGLARVAPPSLEIMLVESEEIGTVGVGEATIPTLSDFNDFLGLDEDEVVRTCLGTFKLGIEFVGWFQQDHRYFHPFGLIGLDTTDFKFRQLWLRLLHAKGDPAVPEQLVGEVTDFSLCALAARAGRFGRAAPGEESLLASMRHALHFDAGRYAGMLRKYAEDRGVRRREGRIVDVRVHPDSGLIDALDLADGTSLKADLFVDCSGFRSLLARQALGAEFDDWSRYLPCDSALTVQSARIAEPPPFTRATADSAGWRWRIPLRSRTGNGYVYSSRHLSDDDARRALIEGLESDLLGEPRKINFRTGHLRTPWIKNCVALGLAAGFVEPLESTSIHLIQTGVTQLVQLFPDRGFDAADIAEYNRQAAREFEQVRDFIVFHYKATRRDDTEFWRGCRDMEIPATLAEKIDLFSNKGRIFRRDGDLFTEESWLAVMLGQGIVPRSYDYLVNKYPVADLARQLGRLRAGMAATAAALPRHSEFLARIARDETQIGKSG